MKKLKYFIEDMNWEFPVGMTTIVLIFMVTQNVIATLQVPYELKTELIKQQWISTTEWIIIVFILSTYLKVGIDYWLVQHGYDPD